MDVLDLDATAPPRPPRNRRSPVVGVRVPATLAVYVREQAYVEHTTINAWMVNLIRRHRDGDRLPADCREWLTIQAAAVGKPGDRDAALVAVLRHLADRWPDGARLNP